LYAAGKRRPATVLFVVLGVLFLAAIAVVLLVPPTRLMSYGANTDVLPILGAFLIAVAAGWLIVALVSHRSLEPTGLSVGKRLGGAAVVMLATSVVVAPLSVAARTVFTQSDLISSISGSGGTSLTTPEIEDESDPWADKPRLNVLLLGGDGGEGRTGIRPDTQIVASIDTVTGATTLISLPRNLLNVPFPADSPLAEIYSDGFRGPGDVGEWMLNAVYRNVPAAHPEVFEGATNPGADANKWAVEGALGIDIDYYALVNLDGFEAIVDALGGIVVDVPRDIPYGNKSLPDGSCTKANGYIYAGPNQTLDGFHALWFARSRCGSDDYDRMARQRCVMNAIVAKADPATLLTQYQALAAATKDIVFTDIPENLFPPLLELLIKVKGSGIKSLTLDDKFFASLDTTSGDPDYDAIHERVAEALAPTPAPAATPETPAATTPPDDSTEAAPAAGSPSDESAAGLQQASGASETAPDADSTGEPDEADPDAPVDAGSVC
jgi:LCP family protein required for cell wall assembly